MTASVGVSEPVVAPGEDSIMSGTSLKNLGSKVVKNLGQICKKSTPHNGSADHGAMSGGMGFGGSMLGEVLVSYSTSTLPPAKRHSISAASAHFEELAAEAGIDLDADDINIEDLRMYRLEEESGYALDDDSDNDDVRENMNDDANAGNQKLAHKERSILQMVDVLSDRLTSLNAVVINRYNGCKSDLDEATDFRSSRTKKMAIAAEDWSSATPRRGADKSKRVTIFHQSSGEGGDGSDAVGPPRMTFRNAPQTDAGRKLAHHFEQEYGMKQASNATPKFSKSSSGKIKRIDHYKKNETRKQERLHFERKLQTNLDQYVTRAVTELVYHVPEEADNTAGPESQEAPRDEISPAIDGQGESAHAPAASEAIARERFPIPMEPNEMNPKLLLSYACERTVLPGGARMFRHFATSIESQHLFVYVFWFIHCKFFQEDSRREQAHLLRAVANRYVGVLGTEGMDEYKDFFFKHYPFVIANAVLWGFHYLCPGSRHLYSNAFKRVLYLQCSRILSGIEVTPSSTTEMRTKLFPDETAEALDELEYHPHHGHTASVRGATAGVAPGGSGSGPSSSSSPELASNTEAVVGAGVGASPPPGAGSGNADKNRADGNGAAVGAVGEDARKGAGQGGGKDKNSGAGEGTGTMIQRMNKTFRPDPLGAYTGDRSTLRFKPRRQEGLTKLKPRQQRTIFDASQISPMLQEYLRQSSSTAGRRSENIVRTVPVPWCQSGGTDTYRRHPPRKELHDAISLEHQKAKREFARGKAQAAEALRRTLRNVDADRHAIFKRGPRQVGLKSMDIVTDLQQKGALKGFKRPEHQWN